MQALETKGLHSSGAGLMEVRREESWVGLTGEVGNPMDTLRAKPGDLGGDSKGNRWLKEARPQLWGCPWGSCL